MFSFPRFLGGLAAAGLTAIVAMPTAEAASTVGYQDPLCISFYTDPLSPRPAQVLKCAKLVCGIATVGSYIQPSGTAITMTVSCTNPPPALTYRWVRSAASPASCPVPQAPTDTTSQIVVQSASPQTCWYEAIVTDGATPANNGWSRYGLKWQ